MWEALALLLVCAGVGCLAQIRGYPVSATIKFILSALRNRLFCCRKQPENSNTPKRTLSNADDDLETGKLLSVSDWGDSRLARTPTFSNVPAGYQSLLTNAEVANLSRHLPSKAQGAPWGLLFSTRLHGYALHTLLTKTKHHGPNLTVVMDDQGAVFGGFASVDWSSGGTAPALPQAKKGPGGMVGEHWARGSVGYIGSPGTLRPNTGYFGGPDCFLFACRPGPLAVHRWTKRNQLWLLSREECIAWGGGGQAGYGLSLDAELERGTSCPCETYGPYTGSLASAFSFKIVQVEVWGFAHSTLGQGGVTNARAQLGALRSQVSAAARELMRHGPPLGKGTGGAGSSSGPGSGRGPA
jgi:hypothetical protein